ncbi:MAG: type II secretion system protein N [Pseudomonadota bacterium]
MQERSEIASRRRPFGSIGLWASIFVVFILSLVASAPASLLTPVLSAVAAPASASFDGVEGTLWHGVIRDVSIEGAHAGQVSYQFHPVALFKGSAAYGLSATGRDIFGKGIISTNWKGRISLSHARFTVALKPFGRGFKVLGAAIGGQATVDLDVLSVTAAGKCASASGSIWTDILQAPAQRFDLSAFDLEGPLKCEGEKFSLALSGDGPSGAADLSVLFSLSGGYEWTAIASPNDDNVSRALRLIGFSETSDGLQMGASGDLLGV